MCPPFSCSTPQENWVKEFIAIAGVLANVGSIGLDVLNKLEEHGVNLTGGLLRSCFEGLTVPDDQLEVFRTMMECKHKTTASMLKEVAAKVRERRQWQWLVCHSQMPEERVHPSRSMYPTTATALPA